MLSLRAYQREALAAAWARFDAGDRATLLVAPTGTGKTVTFAAHAQRTVDAGGRVLVIAHRSELLEQAQAKLRAAGVWAAIEQADRHAGDAPVVVASVQTLKGKRLESWARDAFDDLVIDEAHHARAATYEAIVEWFETARVLGVTATPDRLDGKGLGSVFASCAYRYELRDAIRDGWLVPVVARRVRLEGVDLASVKTRAGDFAQDQLGAVMGDEAALRGAATAIREQAGARRTIAFCVDVAHAHGLAAALNHDEPGCARAVDGTMGRAERAAVLDGFRAGAFRVLTNCEILTEGFDEVRVGCVALVRPTKSRALYAQMAGRGVRPLVPPTEETAEERRAVIAASDKPDVLLLDFTGATGKHRLIGPADVLAGADELDPEVLAELERLLADDPDRAVGDALDEVEQTVQRRQLELAATAVPRYIAEEVDPFLGPLPQVEMDPRWRTEPATKQQLDDLEDAGFEKIPEQLSKADAARILVLITQRRNYGLCSLKQARMVRNAGADPREMPAFVAGNAMKALRGPSRWAGFRAVVRDYQYRRSA